MVDNVSVGFGVEVSFWDYILRSCSITSVFWLPRFDYSIQTNLKTLCGVGESGEPDLGFIRMGFWGLLTIRV